MENITLTNTDSIIFKPIYFSLEPPQPPREWLEDYREAISPDDASEITGISVQTIRAELEAGRLPGNKIGRQWLIPKPAFIAYLYGRQS